MKNQTISISLFNVVTAILMLSSLVCYFYRMDVFSYILAFSLFLAIGVRAWLYEKILRIKPEIKKVPTYKITSWILNLSELILIIGV